MNTMMIQKLYWPIWFTTKAGSQIPPNILAGLNTNTAPTIISRKIEKMSITVLVVLPR